MVDKSVKFFMILLVLASLAGVSLVAPRQASSDPGQPQPYTGILVDARQFSNITRSMNPGVYGPAPLSDLIYPDRSHVPTPDEVQDESTVRYYRTISDAENGVAGSNPMIVEAMSVVGPGKDSVTVSADDEVRMQDLDKQLHYTRTWKFGFLVPANN
jgi:hypothetical protein